MILSYILHGHIPSYFGGHPDDLLHSKLHGRRNLLDLSSDLYEHFHTSLRYSTQALPVNTLLDTLLRPNADTEVNPRSLVEWRYEPKHAISHVVLGNAPATGGQWAENSLASNWDVGTLSYSEMLSLPGDSYEDHYQERHGRPMPELQRPSRTEVANYYAEYPAAVGISDAMYTSTHVESVRRTSPSGFEVSVGAAVIRCRHLVLATGIFTSTLQPPPRLRPLTALDASGLPMLVIGSGFSAADVIASVPPSRRIIHVFKWDPENRPSPLKGCHHQAYPEYAGIYRQMKIAAAALSGRKASTAAVSPFFSRKRNPFFSQRDWASVYEGLPNAEVLESHIRSNGTGVVQIRTANGTLVEREVGGLSYLVGRRGNLDYLDDSLWAEVLEGPSHVVNGVPKRDTANSVISGKTLRARAEVDLEVAPSVFIIGSLTGDSLVRHSFGGCAYVAGRIMGHAKSCSNSPTIKGREGDIRPNGIAHEDLHLDRRKLVTPPTL